MKYDATRCAALVTEDLVGREKSIRDTVAKIKLWLRVSLISLADSAKRNSRR
jgi:hypothetical protein